MYYSHQQLSSQGRNQNTNCHVLQELLLLLPASPRRPRHRPLLHDGRSRGRPPGGGPPGRVGRRADADRQREDEAV